MYYAPHILQKQSVKAVTYDGYGRVVRTNSEDEWNTVCRCRCDRNGTKEFKTDNGGVYRPDFHIVCEGNVELEAGMRVRCIDNGEVKAEGVVYRPQTYNLLPYTEVWI